ncbi:hypothetical protein JYU19_02380 [bacterium AH-315-J21]|nr:hypothetical protein [bacterium AH-315-J21]
MLNIHKKLFPRFPSKDFHTTNVEVVSKGAYSLIAYVLKTNPSKVLDMRLNQYLCDELFLTPKLITDYAELHSFQRRNKEFLENSLEAAVGTTRRGGQQDEFSYMARTGIGESSEMSKV